jgi:hypothetical protein
MDRKMPPQERSLQNDEGFLNLLSRQRGLLQRLNVENTRRQQEQSLLSRAVAEPIRDSRLEFDPLSLDLMNRPLIHSHRGSMPQASLPYSLVNQAPLSVARRPSLDMVSPKRASLAMGGDMDGYRAMFADRERSNQDDWSVRKDSRSRVMKHRRSSMGGISSLSEDSLQSKFSISSRVSQMDTSDSKNSPHEDDSEKPTKMAFRNVPSVKQLSFKEALENFAKAMEKSALSQQNIHDWDRKMGLKKSHSKTMRLCSRSRKKMLSVIKKDIKTLSRVKRS